MKVALLCLARPTFDVPFAQEVADQALADLALAAAVAGIELLGDSRLLFDGESTRSHWARLKAAGPDRLLLLQVTFADASLALELARDWGGSVHMAGFSEPRTGGRLRLNSFCGVNLACHAFNRQGLPYRAAMLAEVLTQDELGAFLTAVTPMRASAGPALPPPARTAPQPGLKAARLLRLGEAPTGFETCRVDEPAFARRFGLDLHALPIDALFTAARQASDQATAVVRRQAEANLSGLDALDQAELEKAYAAGAALEQLASTADAVAVRCWPETFTEYGCAVCGAMARLGGQGKPAACEADLPGTATTLLLQRISGRAALLVDLVDFDRDSAVVWHCGLAPLEMADGPAEATIHSNRRKPLLHQFALKPGTVTLARLSQIGNGWTLLLGLAEMVAAPRAFGGTAGTLRFREPAATVRDRLLHLGMEHHLSFAYGDHRAALLAFAEQQALPVVSLC